MDDTVFYRIDDELATITINRPDNLNALNADVLRGIIESLDIIERASTVRAVMVQSYGEKAFVAGADISTMVKLGAGALRDYVELGQRAMRRIEECKVPVIAIVQGYALGGGLELALACDLIIASSSAKLGQPEVNLGVIPGFGGTMRLIQRCGLGAARRLIFTGDIIDAAAALRLGIVDEVVEPAQLEEHAVAMAKRISLKAPLAVQAAKKVIRTAYEPALHLGLRAEVEAFCTLFESRDREEGMTAFLQKRAPHFEGR